MLNSIVGVFCGFCLASGTSDESINDAAENGPQNVSDPIQNASVPRRHKGLQSFIEDCVNNANGDCRHDHLSCLSMKSQPECYEKAESGVEHEVSEFIQIGNQNLTGFLQGDMSRNKPQDPVRNQNCQAYFRGL